ncbi:MAG: hypothetical protein WBY94_19530 [Polyangiaceae bacterium]
MFLIVMVVGLVGLAVMAFPAFARHGSAPTHAHAGAIGHGAAHGGHAISHSQGHAAAPTQGPSATEPRTGPEIFPPSAAPPSGFLRWIPSPRGVFTALALYGAFGNALFGAFRLGPLAAALGALVPTVLVERFAVRPLWNLVFRLHARPSAPLGELVFNEAMAVTPFRNGRGVVSTNREGRLVQLAARLRDEQSGQTVNVGDRLRIEEVDGARERVTVSLFREQ